MQKIILIYGTISGLVVITSIGVGLIASGGEGGFSSLAFGYLVMLVALSLIFFGIKRYRDQELGGVIKFGGALTTGLAIAAVAGVMYVAVWEIYLSVTDYAFIHDYTAGILAQKKAAGLTDADYAAVVDQMESLTADYAKPYLRLPMTFAEIFPVGALIALISAAILRNPKILPAINNHQ